MIDKGVVYCDHCSEYLETEASEWLEILDAMRENDWKSKKVEDDWEHICPDCQIREAFDVKRA